MTLNLHCTSLTLCDLRTSAIGQDLVPRDKGFLAMLATAEYYSFDAQCNPTSQILRYLSGECSQPDCHMMR
jgi:hypothetical protein